jgi:hypothetical protein
VRWDFGHCGHYWPIVPAPDGRWWWLWRNWWNEDWQGKPKYSEETCPSATLGSISFLPSLVQNQCSINFIEHIITREDVNNYSTWNDNFEMDLRSSRRWVWRHLLRCDSAQSGTRLPHRKSTGTCVKPSSIWRSNDRYFQLELPVAADRIVINWLQQKLILLQPFWFFTVSTVLERQQQSYYHVFGRVRMKNMTGSKSDDWIYWHFGYNFS